MKFPGFAVLLSFMLVSHAPAKSPAETISLPSTDAQVFTLPNGLTIIVDEDRSAPVASVQAWCGTGSIHEGKWMGAGLSHILEHMLFKGTTTRKGGDIARQIQDRGGYINAYTSFDRTVYWIDIPSDGVGEAIDILADAMMNSTLPVEEYDKEQEVIRREFAMGYDDPGRQSSQLMLRTVFADSPFRHPVIGYIDVYNKLTRDDVMEYYKLRYAPNNITFVIAGDVDAQKVKEQLETIFRDVPRRSLEPLLVASEQRQMGRRDAHEEFPTELTRLNLAWRIPGLMDKDTPALELLGEVLGSGRSSLLNQSLREKQRLVHSVSAGMFTLQTDGVFVAQAVCEPDKRELVEKEILAQIDKVKTNGVSEEDLAKARRSLLAGQFGSLATARGRASDLGSNWLLTRNLNFSKDYLDAIAKVTTADLKRVANEYLQTDRLNVTSLNPNGSLVKKEDQKKHEEAAEVKLFTLSNGLRLLVREDSKVPLVSVYATFRGGLLTETAEDNGVTRLLSRTMPKGTKTLTAEEIANRIENVGGSIGGESGNNSFSISAGVMKPDLGLALDLVADILANPSFPKDEVELEKQSQLASIKAEDEQITAVARNVTKEKFFGPHPFSLRVTGSAESVQKLTPETLKAYHAKYVTAKNGVIAVFGDVKAEEVVKLAEKAFASLPAGELALTNPPLPEALKQEITANVEKDKRQAIVMFGYPAPDILSTDRPVMELINEASNDLGSRFFNRIREQLGLAYFVGATSLTGLAPGCCIFYLGTDPAKVEKVRTEFADEIGKLAKEGLTEDELARAKKKLLGSEAIRNQSSGAFAMATALDELLGLGYGAYKERAQIINSITLEDTKRVASKYFEVPGFVETVVSPAAPQAATTPATSQTTTP